MTVSQNGVFHETYSSDQQLRPTSWQRYRIALVFFLIIIFPLVASTRELRIANTVIIAAIGAIGLNILVGYTGQISLGQGAFLAVGAYSTGLLMTEGLPWWLSILVAALITAMFGIVFGIPSLRLKGLYLAVATLAAQQIVGWIVRAWDPVDGKTDGLARELAIPDNNVVFGNRLNDSEITFYVVAMIVLVVVAVLATNLFRTHIGRAFIAIRDQDIAAEVMGVDVFRFKLLSFATSSFVVGLAGGLIAVHSTIISFERFTIEISIEYLAMIIIGGLGSVAGSIYGAAFIKILPEILREVGTIMTEQGWLDAAEFDQILPFIREAAFGLTIIVTLIFEPEGIVKLWSDAKAYFRLWPFNY